MCIPDLLKTDPKTIAPCIETLISNPSSFLDTSEPPVSFSISGRGFRPVSITLGGLFSAAGVIVTLSIPLLRETITTIVTSTQVAEGVGPFQLSYKLLHVLKSAGYRVLVVDFSDPSAGYAEQLLEILREGAMVVNGVSAELALWLGRNAGVGRLMVYRPRDGKAHYHYV